MMIPRVLVLPGRLRDEIASHARAARPAECCGLLVGRGEGTVAVDRIVPAANVAAHPHRRFAVEPQLQFDTLRSLRGTPLRVVGHYHSHPGGPATPSDTDLEMAFDPQSIWLIVAIDGADALQIGAFVRPDGAPSFERIGLSQSASAAANAHH